MKVVVLVLQQNLIMVVVQHLNASPEFGHGCQRGLLFLFLIMNGIQMGSPKFTELLPYYLYKARKELSWLKPTIGGRR